MPKRPIGAAAYRDMQCLCDNLGTEPPMSRLDKFCLVFCISVLVGAAVLLAAEWLFGG